MNYICAGDASKILSLLKTEDSLLNAIYIEQKKIRGYVNNRDWNFLDSAITSVNVLSEKYRKVDDDFCGVLHEKAIFSNRDFYTAIKSIENIALSNEIIETYNNVRRVLVKSKIENNSLSEYIKITNNFIQGVFDNVLPQRKNVLYSKNGTLIKNTPESIVLNTVM